MYTGLRAFCSLRVAYITGPSVLSNILIIFYIFLNIILIAEHLFAIIYLGTFNKLGGANLLDKKGGENMNKKDFLILSLVIIIFLLLFLLFIVLI